MAIGWFWLAISRTKTVRGRSNKEMKFQNKGAGLVQIAPFWIHQPRNQNQSDWIGIDSNIYAMQAVMYDIYVTIKISTFQSVHGVATISRLLETIGLFCKIAL